MGDAPSTIGMILVFLAVFAGCILWARTDIRRMPTTKTSAWWRRIIKASADNA
ncbi:MAG: hypothetical protein WAM56_15930 [Acidobacteriaceae bacterium]